MKKIVAAIASLCIIAAIFSFTTVKKDKFSSHQAETIATINGVDGPTVIFLVNDSDKNNFISAVIKRVIHRCKSGFDNLKYQ